MPKEETVKKKTKKNVPTQTLDDWLAAGGKVKKLQPGFARGWTPYDGFRGPLALEDEFKLRDRGTLKYWWLK